MKQSALRNKRARIRVLLDTPFLLPTLGIDVGEEVLMGLRRLADAEAEIYYSRFSILESLWVAARFSNSPTFDIGRFNNGLRSIMEGGRYGKVEESSEIFGKAIELYMLGHRDMVDNVLYAASSELDLRLLTLDAELGGFVRGRGLKDTLISPAQIA
ncbi:MAG: PIN domain-containing protein [Candidatus Bathyarchaeia archaeon]